LNFLLEFKLIYGLFGSIFHYQRGYYINITDTRQMPNMVVSGHILQYEGIPF